MNRRDFLKGTAAALLAVSGDQPQKHPVINYSATQNFEIPPSTDPKTEKLLKDYKAAYVRFEDAIDASLKEIKTLKDRYTSLSNMSRLRDMVKGITIVFSPDRDKKAGDCYFTFKYQPDERIQLPRIVEAFNAYAHLCTLQNALEKDVIEQAKLSIVPTDRELIKFLSERRMHLPPEEQLSASELDMAQGWFYTLLHTGSTFCYVNPKPKAAQRKGYDLATAFSKDEPSPPTLRDFLQRKCEWYIDEARNMVCFPSKEDEQAFTIPDPVTLQNISRQYPQNSFGGEVMAALLKIDPPEERKWTEFTFENVHVLKKTVPVILHIDNPNFGRSNPAQVVDSAMGR